MKAAVQEALDWIDRNKWLVDWLDKDQMAEKIETKQKELEGVVSPFMKKVFGGPTVEEVD